MPSNARKKRPKASPLGEKGTKPSMDFFERFDSLIDKIYRLAYYLGVQMIRTGRKLNRRLDVWFDRRRDKAAAKRAKRRESFIRWGKNVLRETLTPIVTVRERFSKYGGRLRQAKSSGMAQVSAELGQIVWEVLCLCGHIFCVLFNFIAPVAAILVLIATVNQFRGFQFALSVEYAGESIGYISDESVFEAAETEVKKRIVYGDDAIEASALASASEVFDDTDQDAAIDPEDGTNIAPDEVGQVVLTDAEDESLEEKALQQAQNDQSSLVSMPKYTLAVVREDQLIDQDILTDRIIQASGSEIIQASGLYVDGEFKGASTNPDQVLDTMNEMLDQYAGEQGEDANEKIHFVSKVALKDGLYPVASLKDVKSIKEMLSGNVSGEAYYVVEEGDTPWDISIKTGVPLGELQSMNPTISENFLPGKQLLISRSVPMMKVQVTRREYYEEDIPYQTEREENPKLLKGVEQVITSGVPGKMDVVADITYIDGIEVSRNVIQETQTAAPRNKVVSIGTNVPVPSATSAVTPSGGGFIWPVQGGYISCPIWGYWGHTGTDIAAGGAGALPIMASMSGRVVTATQTYYGYGKHIIIDHGNGYQTLYAHNSALYVNVGDYVTQGQVIAAMGRTGNATGVHCHFEIRSGGQYLDARNFIGYSSPY